MKKVLGLDLGSTSIGWAMIAESGEDITILRAGSHIVFSSEEDVKEFAKGQKQTVNEARRMKRSARRNLIRYKIRRASLIKKLTDLGMMPDVELLKHTDKIELYSLRVKALTEQLSPTELGRVLYHLNQRRGYKSNRKVDKVDEPASDTAEKKKTESNYLQRMEDISKYLHDNNLTIGQHCYNELVNDPNFRIKDTIFLRKDFIKEFNKIWDVQKQFYPSLLTDENLRHIRDRIIYYQRRLKSAKHLVSKCRYETDIPVCPRSSPFHQLRRMYQDINNLRITKKADRTEPFKSERGVLTGEVRLKLLNELESTGSLTSAAILKLLGLSRTEYEINLPKDERGQDLKTLKGNVTAFQIRKALSETGWTDWMILDFDYTKVPDTQPLYKLWHLLYSAEEPEKLKAKLEEKYGFNDAQANALVAKVHLEGDYSSLSVKATKKILPFLAEGLMYSDACDAVGYKHSDSLNKEANLNRPLAGSIALLKWNSLRNPAVEKILNHLVNIVNGIIADPELGRPDEIRVELARELQKSAVERQKMTKNISEREKNHDRIREIIRQDVPWLTKPTRNDIEKYKLWEEFGHASPYEPNHPISITDLFDKNLYQIEHIIPKARLFDDSFANKTIASTQVNRAKGDRTAFDYMNSCSPEAWASFKACIDDHWNQKKLGKRKYEYLTMSEAKIPDNFINRQFNETSYITKKAVEILQPIYPPNSKHVHVTSGTVTDYLKHIWGINDVLKELNREHYERLGRIIETPSDDDSNKEWKIKDWSKRDDHRHHAVDAIVIAATKQSIIQRLNTLNTNYSHYSELKESGPKIKPPSDDFRQKTLEAIASVLVSFKAGKKVATRGRHKDQKQNPQRAWTPRDFLHKETIYGTIRRQKRVKLDTKFDRAPLIIDPIVKQIVFDRLAEYKNDPKKAFAKLEKSPIFYDKEKTLPLTHVTIFDEEYVYKVPLDVNFKEKNVDNIVDEAVKRVVIARLEASGFKSKEAFKDLDNNPVWLNKEAGIKINSVRIFARANKLTPIHIDPQTGKEKDYVFTQNNHHVALYEDENGERFEEVVTFWEAVNRKMLGQELIRRQDEQGRKLVISMQQNELFAFGDELKDIDFSDPKNYPLISKKLFRVQKISTKNYVFRHHLATTIDDQSRMIDFRSLSTFHGFKIFLNRQNRIQAYEEF